AAAGRLRAVNRGPPPVAPPRPPVEHAAGAAGSRRLNQDPAALRGASVVEDDGVRHEHLNVDRVRDKNPYLGAILEVPDDAILDVDGRRRLDADARSTADLPVDHQAAQADDVAGRPVDQDARDEAGAYDVCFAAAVIR